MNIILFGFKRCGKTHFGKLTAKELNLNFIDTDRLLEDLHLATTGKKLSCREIHSKLGPLPFRALEREVIQSMQNVQNSVISLGGGVVLDRDNVLSLEKMGTLIYLKTPKETLKKRIFEGELPDILDPNDPEGSFDRLYEFREPIYEKIHAEIVETDSKKEKDIVKELMGIYKEKYGK